LNQGFYSNRTQKYNNAANGLQIGRDQQLVMPPFKDVKVQGMQQKAEKTRQLAPEESSFLINQTGKKDQVEFTYT